MALQLVNPKAEGTSQKQHALIFNINAAKGLQEVLRSNLGPKGTIKMCVGAPRGFLLPHLLQARWWCR